MRVKLVTTYSTDFFYELNRVKEEAAILGYKLDIVDLTDFSFEIDKKGQVLSVLFEDIGDVYILRGIMHSQKPISELVKHLRKKGARVFDNNFLLHAYSIDKQADILKLALNGISVPHTFFARDFSSYLKKAEEIGYPVIFKAGRMGKGKGVYKFDDRETFRQFLRRLEREGKQAKSFLLQEFIDYKYDLRCLVVKDKVFAMRRIPKEGEFRANFSLGGEVEPFDLDSDGKDLAVRSMNAVGLLYGGVDILITNDNKKYILEVNHNAGFEGMEKATGENIARLYLELAIKEAK